jgi:hypothetical protein
VEHGVLPLLESMNVYDVLVGFPDDHRIDVVFGSWEPAPVSLSVAPVIVPYVTRQLANASDRAVAAVVSRLREAVGNNTRRALDPDAIAERMLWAFDAEAPAFRSGDVLGALRARRGPRYARYFFGQVPLGPGAGQTIRLTAQGFGPRSRAIADASSRSVGAVVAAGLRRAVPPALRATRQMDDPAVPDRFPARSWLTAPDAEGRVTTIDWDRMLNVMQAAESMATRSIIGAISAVVAAAFEGITLANQTEVNRAVLSEISPWIENHLALADEAEQLTRNADPGLSAMTV